MAWSLLTSAAIAYAVVLILMTLFQERLVFLPGVGRALVATPSARGLPWAPAPIRTADGETLGAWWIPAPAPAGAVLVFHGNAGNISHRLDYAVMFRALGYSTLLVDYRGYGESSGTPDEAGTYRDAEAALRWLADAQGLAANDVVMFGESLGGAVAAWLAARHPPRALILASAFTSAPDLGADLYPWLPVRLLARIRYDTRAELRRVRAPVLVAHSPEDDIVPWTHGQALYAEAAEPKAFLALGGGHNDGFVFMRAEWRAAVGDFLARHAPPP